MMQILKSIITYLKIGDIIFFLLFIFLIAFFLINTSAQTNSAIVEIIVQGKKFRYKLNTEKMLTFDGKIGKSKIQIKNGKVRFLSSSCPNKHCVKNGFIEKANEGIICLPNEVSVLIISNKSQVDTIVW